MQKGRMIKTAHPSARDGAVSGNTAWVLCIFFSFGVVSRKEEYFHSSQNDLMDVQVNDQQMHFMCFYLCTLSFTATMQAPEQHFHFPIQGLQDYTH